MADNICLIMFSRKKVEWMDNTKYLKKSKASSIVLFKEKVYGSSPLVKLVVEKLIPFLETQRNQDLLLTSFPI